jgi:predicted anti-sigma-YlaC factor YlaD
MATDSRFGPSACRKHEALLEDYLHQELNGADAKSAIEHWQNCSPCRARLEDARMSMRLLQAAEASPDPGPGFPRRVMTRIRAAENERVALRANFWQLFVSFGWRFAATATLALVVLVSYNARWGHRAQPNALAVRPTDGMQIFVAEPSVVPANGDETLF